MGKIPGQCPAEAEDHFEHQKHQLDPSLAELDTTADFSTGTSPTGSVSVPVVDYVVVGNTTSTHGTTLPLVASTPAATSSDGGDQLLQQEAVTLAAPAEALLAAAASTTLPTIRTEGTSAEHLTAALRAIVDADATGGQAFYLVDIGDVVRKHKLWLKALPRVVPFYAMKCHPETVVLKALAQLGTGFDCASQGEIAAVLAMGVQPERIIYANPCKPISHLTYARNMGVRKMTFDNADELHKIAAVHPQAEVVLRVLADDTKSACRLGLKFGAQRETVRPLIETCHELGLSFIGVSFHVGSGCSDASVFGDAVARARYAFDIAEEMGYRPTLLDVGGGFPGLCGTSELGHELPPVTFEDICVDLNAALDRYFPEGCGTTIIGEPGRYYITSACHLAVQVIAKRKVPAALSERAAGAANNGNHGNHGGNHSHRASAAAAAAAALAGGNHNLSAIDEEQQSPAPGNTSVMVFEAEAALAAMHVDGESPSSLPSSGTASPPPEADPTFRYYVNDSVYGAFNCIMFDHQHPHGEPLYEQPSGVHTFESSIWGETCDSIDKIEEATFLPELSVGDWLLYTNMGAYTAAAATNFNGFTMAEKVYTYSYSSEEELVDLPADFVLHPKFIPSHVGLVNRQ